MATTNLQFTLTSPSPTPTPTPTPTPSTPTYTTTVGSPNTGENSVASDNGGGTVFAALFAVIGFTALAIFLVKYLKKNRHVSFAERGSFHISARPRVYATVALTLAVAFLGGITITNMYNNAKNTEAASQKELEVTVEPSIVFNVDRGESSIKTDTIKVANNGAKYDLYVSSTNNKFTLDSDSTVFLSPVSAAITSPNSAIDINQWGMTTQNISNPDVAASSWAAAPTSETKIKSETTESTTPVTYAINLGDELPDGTYRSSVTYKAIAKNYKVTVINGFVNETGSDTEAWFDADVEVRIRENCSANQAFKVWTIREGLKTAADITLVSSRTYKFTMPANDVTVEATCEGSEPASQWEIHYDKNATGAAGTMDPKVVTGTSTTLDANKFTYTGYTFQGWACNKTATAADFSNSQSNITQAALEAKGCQKTPGDGEATPPTNDYYTLYAIWKTGDIWIQEVTPTMCKEMDLFKTIYLPDKRTEAADPPSNYIYETTYTYDGVTRNTPDGQKHIWYPYTKFADGRCWMLQDLAYQPGSGTVALTTDGTDISANRSVDFTNSYVKNKTSGYSNLYNYKAASAGWYPTNSLTVGKNIPDSLCPASWKIPDAMKPNGDTGDQSGEFYNLANYNIGQKKGGGSTMTEQWKLKTFIMGNTTVSVNGQTFPAPHFTYNGAWDFSTNNYVVNGGSDSAAAGSYASYFINTVKANNMIMAFNPHASGSDASLPLGQDTNPTEGSSVRCLLRTAKQMEPANRAAPDTDAGDYSKND